MARFWYDINRWYDHLNVCLRIQFIYTCLNTPQYSTILLSVLCIPTFDLNITLPYIHTQTLHTHKYTRDPACIEHILCGHDDRRQRSEGISCKADRGKDFCKVHSTCGALVKAKWLFMCMYGPFVYKV